MLDQDHRLTPRASSTKVQIAFKVVDDLVDLPDLIGLAREAHAESHLARIPFSEGKVARIVERALADPVHQGIMLARRGEVPAGALHCSAGEYLVGTGAILATVHTIYVSASLRTGLGGGRVALGLLNGARTWAKARGAVELSVSVASGSGIERTDKLMRRLGFTPTGGNYARSFEMGSGRMTD